MKERPRIFIASPLFNGPQHAILDRIEGLLEQNGYDYYSARKHSGSDRMTPEERRDIDAWNPVFDSNEQGLDQCRVCIAVLEYALPENRNMCLCTWKPGDHPSGYVMDGDPLFVELPDAGTVWETGYLRAQGKLIIGFHSTKRAKHLNLMLTHGCDGLISGFDNLALFLRGPQSLRDVGANMPERLLTRLNRLPGVVTHDAMRFDWSAIEPWGKEVE